MTTAALIAAVERHGARGWRLGDRIRLVPPGRVPAELKTELLRHRDELLRVLPPAPPDVAALPAVPTFDDERGSWIIAASEGDMRLVVDLPPRGRRSSTRPASSSR